MCTLALYFQVFDEFPLVVAANRDEFFSRPSAAPQVLSESPLVVAGKDLLAGGTWLGVSECGLVAGILNRRSAEEFDQRDIRARSRGLLCLDLLKSRDLAQALDRLDHQESALYRPFNLLVASECEAYVAFNVEDRISSVRLEKGLYVLSNGTVFQRQTEKLDRAFALFSRLQDQLRGAKDKPGGWIPALKSVLSDHSPALDLNDPKDSICVHGPLHGTVSSSVIVYSGTKKRFYNYYADISPCRGDFGPPLTLETI
ncbi:MAG: NRDE family protein [Deltaproteobacteria bacterium]|nr:NRDE family protein [Deltaproteobacteria bacterium]